MIPAIEILFSAYIRDGVVFNQLIMFATTTFSALSLNVYCKCGVCAAYATSTHAKCRNVGVYVAAVLSTLRPRSVTLNIILSGHLCLRKGGGGGRG